MGTALEPTHLVLGCDFRRDVQVAQCIPTQAEAFEAGEVQLQARPPHVGSTAGTGILEHLISQPTDEASDDHHGFIDQEGLVSDCGRGALYVSLGSNAPVFPDKRKLIGGIMGRRQITLYGCHAGAGARDEIVKLNLDVSDTRDESSVDQMLEQVVLATLDVDLHQVYRANAVVPQKLRDAHQWDLGRLLRREVRRGSVLRKPDARRFVSTGEAELEDVDSRVVAKPVGNFFREFRHRFEYVDLTAVHGKNIARPLSLVTSEVEYERPLRQIVVEAQVGIPFGGIPIPDARFGWIRTERCCEPEEGVGAPPQECAYSSSHFHCNHVRAKVAE